MEVGGLWSRYKMSSVHPTFFGRTALILLSFLRLFFLYEPFNLIFDFDYTEAVHICVFLIGVFIAIECLFSVVSYMASLGFFNLVKEYRIFLRFQAKSFFVLLFSASSIANSVWLFIQVRDLWTQYLIILIQILHGIPSLLLVIQSLIQGWYLHIWLETEAVPSREKVDHLQSQVNLNRMFLVYVLTTNLAIAYYCHSVFMYQIASCLYMLGEVAYRLYTTHLLKSLMVAICEEPFQSPIQEESYDPTKDCFCSGLKERLPLLNVFCRWVLSAKHFIQTVI